MFKINNKKYNKGPVPYEAGGFRSGFTIIEMLVVLAIFAVMSSIIIFNYPKFQAQIDIKNTATDVALQIVQAQRDAVNGKLNGTKIVQDPWKPSYGVYFSKLSKFTGKYNTNEYSNKGFIYYIDSYNFSSIYGCFFNSDVSSSSNECLNQFIMQKGIYVSNLVVNCNNGSNISLDTLDINFTRPTSSPKILDQSSLLDPRPSYCASSSGINYAEITLHSPQNLDAYIDIYASGRVQIK